jgi:hypothetical protein
MKRFGLAAVAAMMVLGLAGFGVIEHTRAGDKPECCQKHESCCPGSSCCSGGSHGQCPMHAHGA